jgi:succinate-semialdehyde dehydrogenase / glutarate-semialdehyde dehydrogenase
LNYVGKSPYSKLSKTLISPFLLSLPKIKTLQRTTDLENTPAVSKELCTNPLVRKISFTGSTNVGKQLMALSSSTIKRLSLELGGNAPFLVFDDALLDQAVTAAISSKFRNAGQTCVCADRFLVQRNIYEEFLERLAQAMDESIVVGNGLDPKTTMGPLISAQSRDRVHAKVKAAVLEGAGIVRGGGSLESLPGYFYAPTLLRDVSVESDIWKTETFGPVAAVLPFDTEEEGIAIANDSNLGLASYVMTRDLARTFRVSKALEAGMVGVNDGILSTCTAPFGGIKESGLGREGGTAGLHEYLETKYVFINY